MSLTVSEVLSWTTTERILVSPSRRRWWVLFLQPACRLTAGLLLYSDLWTSLEPTPPKPSETLRRWWLETSSVFTHTKKSTLSVKHSSRLDRWSVDHNATGASGWSEKLRNQPTSDGSSRPRIHHQLSLRGENMKSHQQGALLWPQSGRKTTPEQNTHLTLEKTMSTSVLLTFLPSTILQSLHSLAQFFPFSSFPVAFVSPWTANFLKDTRSCSMSTLSAMMEKYLKHGQETACDLRLFLSGPAFLFLQLNISYWLLSPGPR